MTVRHYSYIFSLQFTPHYLLHNTCLEFELKKERGNGNKRREKERGGGLKGGEMEGENERTSKKEEGKKTFAMPIIFKELRTGPWTGISKMENAGIHHAVGR